MTTRKKPEPMERVATALEGIANALQHIAAVTLRAEKAQEPLRRRVAELQREEGSTGHPPPHLRSPS